MKTKSIVKTSIIPFALILAALVYKPAKAETVNVPKGAVIVKVEEQTTKGFQVDFLVFPDQHTAEEFADVINSTPAIKYRPTWKVWQHATVYAK